MQEARCLLRARKVGVDAPLPLYIDSVNYRIVMERVDGPTVKAHLCSGNAITKGAAHIACIIRKYAAYVITRAPNLAAELAGLAANIGLGIARLHNAGIVHGDLTTSNVMLRASDDSVGASSVAIVERQEAYDIDGDAGTNVVPSPLSEVEAMKLASSWSRRVVRCREQIYVCRSFVWRRATRRRSDSLCFRTRLFTVPLGPYAAGERSPEQWRACWTRTPCSRGRACRPDSHAPKSPPRHNTQCAAAYRDITLILRNRYSLISGLDLATQQWKTKARVCQRASLYTTLLLLARLMYLAFSATILCSCRPLRL